MHVLYCVEQKISGAEKKDDWSASDGCGPIFQIQIQYVLFLMGKYDKMSSVTT